MALLPQDTRRQSMLLVMILAIAGAGLYYTYVTRPGSARLREMTDRIEDLQTQNQLAETRIGNLQDLRDRLSLSEAQFTALERLVPESAEVPEIYEAIATQTQALNLRLISVEPSVPAPADSGAYFMRQRWEMRVEGEYHAVGTFLARVASFDRILRPQITEVIPTNVTPSRKQMVTATFGLETFVLAPKDEGAGEESAEESE
jgi:Tfp pilus assembly protein PilO